MPRSHVQRTRQPSRAQPRRPRVPPGPWVLGAGLGAGAASKAAALKPHRITAVPCPTYRELLSTSQTPVRATPQQPRVLLYRGTQRQADGEHEGKSCVNLGLLSGRNRTPPWSGAPTSTDLCTPCCTYTRSLPARPAPRSPEPPFPVLLPVTRPCSFSGPAF